MRAPATAALTFALVMCSAPLAADAQTRASVETPREVPAQSAAAPRTITVASPAAPGQTVAAEAGTPVQVLFADGATVVLAPGSALVVEGFTLGADERSRLALRLTRGAFRFIARPDWTKADRASLGTPHGTLDVGHSGLDVTLDSTPPHADLLFGDGFSLAADGRSERVRERVYKAGFSLALAGAGRKVIRTPPAWRAAVQARLLAPVMRPAALPLQAASPAKRSTGG